MWLTSLTGNLIHLYWTFSLTFTFSSARLCPFFHPCSSFRVWKQSSPFHRFYPASYPVTFCCGLMYTVRVWCLVSSVHWLYFLFPLNASSSVCVHRSVVPDSATPWTVVRQAPLSMGFFRQEYWSGLPCPPPGDLPNPGIEPRSPALQADSLPPEPPGKRVKYGVLFQ